MDLIIIGIKNDQKKLQTKTFSLIEKKTKKLLQIILQNNKLIKMQSGKLMVVCIKLEKKRRGYK